MKYLTSVDFITSKDFDTDFQMAIERQSRRWSGWKIVSHNILPLRSEGNYILTTIWEEA